MNVKLILEEYNAYKNQSNKLIEYYINPTKKELNDLEKSAKLIRFLVDFKTKKIYLFDAIGNIHMYFYSYIFKNGNFTNDILNLKIFTGMATLKNGKAICIRADSFGQLEDNEIDYYTFSKYLLDKHQWINQYVDCTDYLTTTYNERESDEKYRNKELKLPKGFKL